VETEDGRVGGGVKRAQVPLLSLTNTLRVRRQHSVEDRRLRRQRGAVLQPLVEGQLIRPDECQTPLESSKPALPLPEPELLESGCPDDHETRPGAGRDLQT